MMQLFTNQMFVSLHEHINSIFKLYITSYSIIKLKKFVFLMRFFWNYSASNKHFYRIHKKLLKINFF